LCAAYSRRQLRLRQTDVFARVTYAFYQFDEANLRQVVSMLIALGKRLANPEETVP
jgi:hypothetical protein